MTKNNNRPLILISNDDGWEAPGINYLADVASELGDVVVVAPEGPRSGASLSVTFHEPVKARKVSEKDGLEVWACSGTPGDCIKLGLAEICPRRPDLVLGGINHGDNSGVNVHYSGTMGVVIEGCLKGISSIGFSHCSHAMDTDFTPMRPYIKQIMEKVLAEGLPEGVCLNVNAPDTTEYQGVKVCSMGQGIWGKEWERRQSPRGWTYYWLVGEFTSSDDENAETDYRMLKKGFFTITPTRIEMTAQEAVPLMKKMFEQ